MNTDRREELARKADEVRSHMMDTLAEFERKSHDRIDTAGPGETQVRTEEAEHSPERRRLEREADHVRNHMIDAIDMLEKKAREKLVPIVMATTAAVFVLTIGFGFLLYRAVRR